MLHTSFIICCCRIAVIAAVTGRSQKSKRFVECLAEVGSGRRRWLNEHGEVVQLLLVLSCRQSEALAVARVTGKLDVVGKREHANLTRIEAIHSCTTHRQVATWKRHLFFSTQFTCKSTSKARPEFKTAKLKQPASWFSVEFPVQKWLMRPRVSIS